MSWPFLGVSCWLQEGSEDGPGLKWGSPRASPRDLNSDGNGKGPHDWPTILNLNS